MKFELAAVSAGEVHTGRGVISLVAWRTVARAACLLPRIGPCLPKATGVADRRCSAVRFRAVGDAGRANPSSSLAPLAEAAR